MKPFAKSILAAGLLMVALPACDLLWGSEKCGGKAEPFFDVQGMKLLALQRTNYQPVSGGSSVAATNVVLQLSADVRYYSHTSSNGFLPAAMACSPVEPGYGGTAERIDSLTIISRYDYDAQHPAGTSLNDLLVENSNRFSLTQSLQNDEKMPRQHYLLTLRTGPLQAGNQQFVLRYRQTNGEVYTAETPVFVLLQ